MISLLLLAFQGPRLFHLLLVAHAPCEHGELIEVDRGQISQRISPVDPPSAERSQGPSFAPGHSDSADHEHCDILALRHLHAQVGPAIVAPSLLTIESAVASGERGEERPVPLLALAPKGSPPSV